MPPKKVNIHNDTNQIRVSIYDSIKEESFTLLKANRINEEIWSLTYGYNKNVSKTEIELKIIIGNFSIIYGPLNSSQSSGREVFEITAAKKSDLKKWSKFCIYVEDLRVLEADYESHGSVDTWNVIVTDRYPNDMSTDDFHEFIKFILQTYGKIKIVKKNELGPIKVEGF